MAKKNTQTTNTKSFAQYEREARIQENNDSYHASFDDCNYDSYTSAVVGNIRGNRGSNFDYDNY